MDGLFGKLVSCTMKLRRGRTVRLTSMSSSESEVQESSPSTPSSSSAADQDATISPPPPPPQPLGPTGFPHFNRLPAELQIMIWQATFPGPRDVELAYVFDRRFFAIFDYIMYASILSPVTLQVCHQSRITALRTYTMFFCDQRGIYIDPTIDTLVLSSRSLYYLGRTASVRQASREERSRLKNVAFNIRWRDELSEKEGLLRCIFERFSGLETLVIHRCFELVPSTLR